MKMKRHITAVVWALAATGCLVDTDDPCSPGEEQNLRGYCVCKANHVPIDRGIILPIDPSTGAPREPDPRAREGCTPCGDNEEVQGGRCVCQPGFVETNQGCVASNLGQACTGDADCADGDQTFCAPAGYCTRAGCTAHEDCESGAGWICLLDDGMGNNFCRRPPVGEGQTCPDPTNPMDPSGGCATQIPDSEVQACFPLDVTCVALCDPNNDLCSANRECCSVTDPGSGMTFDVCLEECP